jgi:hypothetical protein
MLGNLLRGLGATYRSVEMWRILANDYKFAPHSRYKSYIQAKLDQGLINLNKESEDAAVHAIIFYAEIRTMEPNNFAYEQFREFMDVIRCKLKSGVITDTYAAQLVESYCERFRNSASTKSECALVKDNNNDNNGSIYPQEYYEKHNKNINDIEESSEVSNIFMAELPSLENNRPKNLLQLDSGIVMYFENVTTIGEEAGIEQIFKFPQMIVISEKVDHYKPILIVRGEESIFGTSQLGMVTPSGDILNIGDYSRVSEREFMCHAVEAVRNAGIF